MSITLAELKELDQKKYQIKLSKIKSKADKYPLLTDTQLQLINEISNYYKVNLMSVIDSVLPPALWSVAGKLPFGINCTDLSSILFSERLSPNIILCSVIIISLFDLFAI